MQSLENYIDGSGKGMDPQYVCERKKTQEKHIIMNAIMTTIPRWNTEHYIVWSMVEKDTKLCVNIGNN